jgi:hypothetical protein
VTPGARLKPWHGRLALAALVALLFRAWIPAGFMPASDGSLALILCPGSGPVLSPIHDPHDRAAHHHHHDGQREKGADAPCPFGAFAAAPPERAMVPPPPASFAALAAPSAPPGLAASFPYIVPPSTGPPTRL